MSRHRQYSYLQADQTTQPSSGPCPSQGQDATDAGAGLVPLPPVNGLVSMSTTMKPKNLLKEPTESPRAVPQVCRRRKGGRVLPTGVLKKVRADSAGSQSKAKDGDMRAHYLKEVKNYEKASGEEDKTSKRPLVK